MKGKPTKKVLAERRSKLAIDLAATDWRKRPMYLRPYHPTYLVCYYGRRFEEKDVDSAVKWNPLVERLEIELDLVVRMVECYDDACVGCQHLHPDPCGSVWGAGYTCRSTGKTEIAEVTHGNQVVLARLGLAYGSELLMRSMIHLLAERIPVLDSALIGGPSNQQAYERGLKDLKAKYK